MRQVLGLEGNIPMDYVTRLWEKEPRPQQLALWRNVSIEIRSDANRCQVFDSWVRYTGFPYTWVLHSFCALQDMEWSSIASIAPSFA